MLMTLFMFHVNNILSTAPSSTSSYTHTCIKASSAPSGSSTFPARESLEAECGKSSQGENFKKQFSNSIEHCIESLWIDITTCQRGRIYSYFEVFGRNISQRGLSIKWLLRRSNSNIRACYRLVRFTNLLASVTWATWLCIEKNIFCLCLQMETAFCLCLVMETVGLVAVWDTAAVELWYSAEKKALKQTSLNTTLCLYRNIRLYFSIVFYG